MPQVSARVSARESARESAWVDARVSVVIPTFNRLARLKTVLAALERQSYPREDFEVVVVSDGCTDGTNDYLRNVTTTLCLQSIMQANGGVASARNQGLQVARGEFILFIDDDIVATPELIAEHMATHQQHDDTLVVLGPSLIPYDIKLQPWVRWEQAMLTKQYSAMLAGEWAPTARQFYTGNMSIARRHILQAGGFDARFRRAEDVELGYRLAACGLSFLFNPKAIAYHYAERSFKAWLEIPYAYGRNDVIFTLDKGQQWLLPTVLREFHGRNPLVRLLARLCLDRPAPSALAVAALRCAAWAGDVLEIEACLQAAYSGIFNLRHYQGIADELGGRRVFFAQVERVRPRAAVPRVDEGAHPAGR